VPSYFVEVYLPLETVVYVTSAVPRGAVRRIDAPAPGNCPF
jgi:hypothetical protein